MKARNLYALLVALVAATSLLLSCSDNDDPQPVLEPGEIPMADSIPSAYLGVDFVRQLTVDAGAAGAIFANQPLISIYDNASDKEEATAKYDAELYFVRLADGKEYRPGEALPYSDKRNPIGHHMDIYPEVERDVAPLILGNIEYNVDGVPLVVSVGVGLLAVGGDVGGAVPAIDVAGVGLHHEVVHAAGPGLEDVELAGAPHGVQVEVVGAAVHGQLE